MNQFDEFIRFGNIIFFHNIFVEIAVNEFFKDLWHDIFNERIPHGKRVIVEYASDGGIYYRSIKIPDDIQWVRGFSCEKRLMRWLYIDDLFPKEGGDEK